jgi:O-antigen/teichoic acid export membrane protein
VRFLATSPLLRGVAWLSGGTLAAQALLVLTAPILGRLYTPEQFGVLAVYLALLVLGASIASLRYETAIPLADTDEDAIGLVWLSVLLSAATSILLGALPWILRVPTSTVDPFAQAPWIWILLPASIFLTALFEAAKQWGIRQRLFRPAADAGFVQAIVQSGSQVGFGLIGPTALVLVLGDVLSRLGAATRILTSSLGAFLQTPPHGLRRLARTFRQHPIFGAGYALAGLASLQLAPLLLSVVHGDESAGWFAMSTRVIGLPTIVLGAAVSAAFLGEGARLWKESPERFLPTLSKLSLVLIALGAVALLPIILLGPTLFAFVLGDPWREAGVYARILATMFLLEFIAAPLASTLTVLQRQRTQLVWAVLRLGFVLLVFFAATRLDWDPRTTIAAYSATLAASFLALYGHTLLIVHRAAPRPKT